MGCIVLSNAASGFRVSALTKCVGDDSSRGSICTTKSNVIRLRKRIPTNSIRASINGPSGSAFESGWSPGVMGF